MTQLTFTLPLPVRCGRDDFWLAPCNRHAFESVLTPWDGLFWLHGVEGSGKTHLAHIWLFENGAVLWPDVGEAVLVENAERYIGDAQQEAALFHAINAKTRLLFTSRVPLETLTWQTPDLASRLKLAQTKTLLAPDLELMEAVLLKIFHDHQMRVHPRFLKVIAHQLPSSLTQAERFVRRLDRITLSRKQAVQAKNIRDAFESLEENDKEN